MWLQTPGMSALWPTALGFLSRLVHTGTDVNLARFGFRERGAWRGSGKSRAY